jgi:hypothetical protein
MDEKEKKQAKVEHRLVEYMPEADAEMLIAAALSPNAVMPVLMAELAWDNLSTAIKSTLAGSLSALEMDGGDAPDATFISPAEQRLARLRARYD